MTDIHVDSNLQAGVTSLGETGEDTQTINQQRCEWGGQLWQHARENHHSQSSELCDTTHT